jgi:hypothetical protein
MTITRLSMSQEGLLWNIALKQFGATGLSDFVVKQWAKTRPPARATVEYLDIEFVGKDVLSILRIAQKAVGAVVPGRPIEPGRIAIYTAHAEHLANRVLKIIPVGKLPSSFRGTRLETDLGI